MFESVNFVLDDVIIALVDLLNLLFQFVDVLLHALAVRNHKFNQVAHTILSTELSLLAVRNPVYFNFLLVADLITNVVLESCVLGWIFLLQSILVKDVVP